MTRADTRIGRRKIVAAAGSALGLAALGSPAIAQTGRLTARVGVLVNDTHPSTIAWRRFAQLIADRTNRAVEVQVFPNSQLGGEREVAEGMRLGSIQGGNINVAVLSSWVPEGQLFDMPFIFRDLDHATRVVAGPIGQGLAEKYLQHGFRVLGYWNNGVRHPIGRFPINAPADVRGKKMRVIQSPLHIELWTLLGANPTPIPAPEIYTSLQTGVVDCFDNSKASYLALRFYEVARYFTDLGHIYGYGAFAFSEIFWRRLSAAQQEIFRRTAAEIIAFQDNLAAFEDENALARTVELGAQVIRPDRAPWVAVMRPFWERFGAQVGGMQAIQRVIDTA